MVKKFLLDLKYIYSKPHLLEVDRNVKTVFYYFILIQILCSLINLITLLPYKIFFGLPQMKVHPELSFLSIIIIGPIIEEFMFRSILVKTKLNYILCVLSFIFFFRHDILNRLLIIFPIAVLLIAFSIFLFEETIFFQTDTYYNKNLLALVFFSSFLFGFGHVFNFELSNNTIFFLILFAINKTFFGFFNGMFRLKFGLFYSIALHSITNFIIFYFIK